MTARIERVGIVAKQGLLAASEHLARLGAWLRERGIEPVYETTTALLPNLKTRLMLDSKRRVNESCLRPGLSKEVTRLRLKP